MKSLIVGLLILFANLCYTQSNIKESPIDSINNDLDFSNFILKNSDKDFLPLLENKNGYKNPMCNRIYDSLKVTNWFKSDLNNDGLTDLFYSDFNLEQMKLCVFNFGGNNYKVEIFPINLITECVFVKPVKVQNLNLLELYYQAENTKKIDKRLITYKFNKFVEYNPRPAGNSINYICFDMLGIKDKSNAFSLRVDRQGIIELKYYDSEEKLVVRKDTSQDLELKNMFQLADYTDFLSIDYDYSDISEEYYSGKLVFGYGVNSVKEIKFYKGIFEHFIIRDIIGYFFRKKFELVN